MLPLLLCAGLLLFVIERTFFTRAHFMNQGQPFRVQRHSLWPRLLGSDCCTFGRVIHVRDRAGWTPSPTILSHEFCHVLQQQQDRLFLVKYLCRPHYRRAMEADAQGYGLAHTTDPYWVSLSRVLCDR